MSVRTKIVTVTDMGISPKAISDAGVVDEHNATLLKFILPMDYIDNNYLYFLDIVNGSGGESPTDHIPAVLEEVNGDTVTTVSFELPDYMTRLGVANVTLNVEELNAEDNTVVDLLVRTIPISLQFKGQKKTNGVIILELTDMFNSLLVRIEVAISASGVATANAVIATENAVTATKNAVTATQNANNAANTANESAQAADESIALIQEEFESLIAIGVIYIGDDEPTNPNWQIWIDTDDDSYGAPGVLQVLPTGASKTLNTNTLYYGTLPSSVSFVLPISTEIDLTQENTIHIYALAEGTVTVSNWGTNLFALGYKPQIAVGEYDIEFRWSPVSSKWCVMVIFKGVVT